MKFPYGQIVVLPVGAKDSFVYDWLMDNHEVSGSAGGCGRHLCALCAPPCDLGPAPELPPGEFTYGICPACRERFFGPLAVKLLPARGPD